MRYQMGGNQGEDDKPEIGEEPAAPEIKDDELDRVSGGGGNSAWGTVQQSPPGSSLGG
jgi:hypothetical protein